MKTLTLVLLLVAPFLNAQAGINCITASGKLIQGTQTSSDDLYNYYSFKVGNSLFNTKSVTSAFVSSDQSFKLVYDAFTGLGTAKINQELVSVDCTHSQ